MDKDTLDIINQKKRKLKWRDCLVTGLLIMIILIQVFFWKLDRVRLYEQRDYCEIQREVIKENNERVEKKVIDEVIHLLYEDIKRDIYLEGWDVGYKDGVNEKFSLLPPEQFP